MEFLEFLEDQGNLLIASVLQILGLLASGFLGKEGPRSARALLYSGSLLICLSLLSFPVMLYWRYTTDWFHYRPDEEFFQFFEYGWTLGVALQLVGVVLLAKHFRGLSERLAVLEEITKNRQKSDQ